MDSEIYLEVDHGNSGVHNPPYKKNRWKLLKNVICAISRLRHYEASPCPDLDNLLHEIKRIPTDEDYKMQAQRSRENSPLTIAVCDLRREQSFFEAIERGGSDDIEIIKELVDDDPYKHVLSIEHPYHFLNKRNKEGHIPLYVAAKHGNLAVVKLLLELGADYNLTSDIGGEQETSFEVAIRWGYIPVIQELNSLKWPERIYKKVKTITKNARIKNIIRKRHKRRSSKWCCVGSSL